MSDIQHLIVSEFISNERDVLIRTEQEIREVPMTYDQKLKCFEAILKKGIAFGIEKGVFLEQARRSKVDSLKQSKKERLIDELIFDINDDIMKFRNLPRVKYNKKKYRKKKGIVQLNFLNALGFKVDII